MWELLLMIVGGILVGVVSGLVPGVHINLVAALVVSFSSVLLQWLSPLGAALFIVSLSVTHNFLDFVPSTYLAAPSAETCEGVLPAHRLLREGKGHEAVFFSVIGMVVGLVISAIMFIPLVEGVKVVYKVIERFIPAILIMVVGILIFREEKKLIALLVCLLSGALGLVVLNAKFLDDPLLPLLSGMFGISGMIMSIAEGVKIQKQSTESDFEGKKGWMLPASVKALVASCATSFLPGLSGSHSTLFACSFSKMKEREVLFVNGFVNAASIMIGLIALFAIKKARNGAVVAMSELIEVDAGIMLALVAGVLISCGVSAWLALRVSKMFSLWIEKVNYKKVCFSVIALVVALTFVVSGLWGVFVLGISVFLGFLPLITKVNRNHLMCVLIVPVVAYFLF